MTANNELILALVDALLNKNGNLGGAAAPGEGTKAPPSAAPAAPQEPVFHAPAMKTGDMPEKHGPAMEGDAGLPPAMAGTSERSGQRYTDRHWAYNPRPGYYPLGNSPEKEQPSSRHSGWGVHYPYQPSGLFNPWPWKR